ncbi:phage tail tube protein [Methylocystis hirsuta]|uniref:Uncharacterized protein n=1 Tax=Methylocystis hirsuta TaxID=369798 RepID=A0A3M9XMY9_9HYPH|nr:phage tail tube protein [Methylocystis hirsuta]RNJ49361.1 hypothetical protein D1O30_06875 [Methylocystis hirsuta]
MASVTDCCSASGGRASIAINGVNVSPRSVSVTPTNFEREVKSNQDGTIYTINKPMPAEAEMTLSDSCGLDILGLMGCPVDVTIDLWDVRRKYLFTRGVIVGRPKLNTETGEISGLKITANRVIITTY